MVRYGRVQHVAWVFVACMVACSSVPPLPIVEVPEDRNAAISPDGAWIVFEHSDPANPVALYLAHPDGTARQVLADGAFEADWAPSGTAVTANLGATIVVITIASRQVRTLTAGYGAAWSPDGNTIAFSYNGGVNSNPPDIWTVPAGGGTPTRVPLPGPPHDELREVDWSSDGSHLVAAKFSGRSSLFITTTSGNDSTVISISGYDLQLPSWSPAGDRIAYVRSSGGSPDVWIVRPDGSGHRRLATNGSHPRWYPDGSRIVFSRRSATDVSLWSVDTLGQNLRQLWSTSPP
jgi:Tol biopolymer transport system component